MTVTFSALDSSSGLPDKVYSFGTLNQENVSKREEITISQEIIGAYLIPNVTPDYEGISFLLEDDTYLRVGMDQNYTPSKPDHIIFGARLIGFSAKFGWDTDNLVHNPGELGLITDTTSCEEAEFTNPNPFTVMNADVFTGATVSQT